jgi:hypothetical protein
MRSEHSFGEKPVTRVLDCMGRSIALLEAEGLFATKARDMIRAVNSHDVLYEALERITRVASLELTGKRDDVLEQAREALRFAEKGE